MVMSRATRVFGLMGVVGLLLADTAWAAGQLSIERRVTDRLVRYASISTPSKEGVDKVPSTDSQFRLAKLLVDELKAIGLGSVRFDSHGYVYATLSTNLPASKARSVPSIGLIAHLDCSDTVAPGTIRPIVHQSYSGGDLVLPGDKTQVIRVASNANLNKFKGSGIVTSDGTTLLGADDKAGIAEIVTALEELIRHPEIPRPTLKIVFTPDEEIGRSCDFLDVRAIGAKYAYTIDGDEVGVYNDETFNAAMATVTFCGKSSHPGDAKGRMINSLYAAAWFVGEVPTKLRAEHSSERKGYIHPMEIKGNEERSTVSLLIRDFTREGMAAKSRLLERMRRRAADKFPGTSVKLEVREEYRNMKEVLDRTPFVSGFLAEAIERGGLKASRRAVRGGTDGSALSFRGLPTANVFTGAENVHSKLEWVSTKALEQAVATIVRLTEIWATKGASK